MKVGLSVMLIPFGMYKNYSFQCPLSSRKNIYYTIRRMGEITMGFKISNLFDDNNVANPKGLKKHNFPYIFIWIIYYAWVIAFATWWTASPITENVFGSQIRSLMHSINLLSSAVFMIIIKKEWFVQMARIGAICIILGMTIFLTVPSAYVQVAAAVIIGIALGCVNISILIPFVFSVNNTGKLYALVGTNLLICLISLFQNVNNGNNLRGNDDLILSFVVLIIALSAIIFFKKSSVESDCEDNTNASPKFPRRVYLTLLFNCAFAIVGIIGYLIYFALYAFASKPFALLGIGNTVGMINMYYIIGVVGKKYRSM